MSSNALKKNGRNHSKDLAKSLSPEDYRIPPTHHSKRVSRLKILTTLTSIILILLMLAWPLTKMGKKNFKVTFEGQNGEGLLEEPSMLKPRFHGTGKSGNPYNITSDEAVQTNQNKMALQKVNGDMVLKDGSWMTILSETGDYNIGKKEVDLNGSVNLIIDTGYEMNTESAHINLSENMAAGEEAVTVHGPMGVLTADGFIIREGGNEMIFHGNVHMITIPK